MTDLDNLERLAMAAAAVPASTADHHRSCECMTCVEKVNPGPHSCECPDCDAAKAVFEEHATPKALLELIDEVRRLRSGHGGLPQ